MSITDVFNVFSWWGMFFILGVIFLPFTLHTFSGFFDKGYIFSKILGMAVVSYTIFFLGTMHLIPFTIISIFCVVFGVGILSALMIYRKKWHKRLSSFLTQHFWIFLFEEIAFLFFLFFWGYIHSFAPDIHGLEKYMDFGFINSLLRTTYFPPKDMWFTPYSINYYYFGHLTTAVLTKLSGIPQAITFNLMLSTIASLTFVASFSIGANILFFFYQKVHSKRIILGGLLTGFLVAFAGNLHILYSFFTPYKNESPLPLWNLGFNPLGFPNNYWYPNATRFIYNTIHEFPIYSWVVADLHGHVLDIPYVLLTVGVLISLFFKSEILNSKFETSKNVQKIKYKTFEIAPRFGGIERNWKFTIRQWHQEEIGNLLLIGFLLAVMYMTNAWDGLMYFGLTVLVLFAILFQTKKGFRHYFITLLLYCSITLFAFFIFALPFNKDFQASSIVHGIGVVCAPPFLTDMGNIGPFLFEKDHCQKSPWWQLLTLYGFFIYFVSSFVVFLSKHKKKNQSDIFVLILIIFSFGLIVIPEFFYMKDIYPAHYRANTMFKLVFQAFMLLSIASSYIFIRIISNFKFQISLDPAKQGNFKFMYLLFAICSLLLFSLVFLYPFQAINSYYGISAVIYPKPSIPKVLNLDGTKYLQVSYPDDYKAIQWLNKTIIGQPVVLEAQGDSYTDFGRVSTNTGLPTVLGWTVHEWLWRGTYDIPAPRIEEIRTLYEAASLTQTEQLLKKYNITYVFIGTLERQKYINLNEEKFTKLGKVVFESGQTRVYRISGY